MVSLVRVTIDTDVGCIDERGAECARGPHRLGPRILQRWQTYFSGSPDKSVRVWPAGDGYLMFVHCLLPDCANILTTPASAEFPTFRFYLPEALLLSPCTIRRKVRKESLMRRQRVNQRKYEVQCLQASVLRFVEG